MRLGYVLLVCSIAVVAVPAHGGKVCLRPTGSGAFWGADCDVPAVEYPIRYDGYSENRPICSNAPDYVCPLHPPSDDPITYGFTVSASDTWWGDNTGSLPEGAVALYLWYVCASGWGFQGGVSGAEFSIDVEGFQFDELRMRPQWLNFGSKTDVQLAIGGCPQWDSVVAEILITNEPTPVEAGTWGRVKALYK